MQRPHNDRWERIRRHLLRNLFDHQGELSPVIEESASDSFDEDRPCSPLPDLIVEREPNRHDHSEEYYDALAVRMRKYYKKLFIDGVSDYEASVDDLEENPDFVIRQSPVSTIIIDTNNHKGEDTSKYVADGTGEEFDLVINEDRIAEVSKSIEVDSTYLSSDHKSDTSNITDGKDKSNEIQHSSHDVSGLSHVVIHLDEAEVKDTANITEASEVPDKDASKSIETESDLLEACHRISSTVAEVHCELQRVKAPRVYEDGSPVLMPKARELSRKVFGNTPVKARNILDSVRNDEEEVKDVEENVAGYEKETQDISKEIEDLKPSSSSDNSDFDIEWLIKSADCVSNDSQESVETCEEEVSFEDVDRNETPDSTPEKLHESDNKDRKAIDDDESPLRTSESDEITQVHNEESIGPNEFNGVESTKSRYFEIQDEKMSDLAGNSFELAIRKGIFETKNARKNIDQGSSEEFEDDSENKEFEPIEVMRGTMQARLTESLRRESTLSKESPLVVPATNTIAELEEDDFEAESCQNEAFDPVRTETRDEVADRSLEIDLTTSQDSSSTDENGTKHAEEFGSTDDLQCVIDAPAADDSCQDPDTRTPSGAKIRSIAEVCNEIWSVSPVKINFEELPPKFDDNSLACKMDSNRKRVSDSDLNVPLKKKKKYNNIAVQTGTSEESANRNAVNNNFLVGRPLVFRLCRCRNHVCP